MKLLKRKGGFAFILLLGLLWGMVSPVAAQGSADVGVFEDLEVKPNTAFEVPISIRHVEELYALDVEVRFDPAILQVEDAAPNQDGVQVGLGIFLDAGLILYNRVDNTEGVIRFAMTQVNPSEPKSGEGVVLVLYLVSQAEGESTLEVSFAEASDRLGNAILMDGVDAVVTVSSGAAERSATEIPVQDVAQVTIIPTMASTPTPTITPTYEPTPTPEVEEEVVDDAQGVSSEESTADESGLPEGEESQSSEDEGDQAVKERATILNYWWVVLLVVVAAGGLGAYLLLSKKKA